ncbi:MAG: thioredoxin family protein [Thermogutta sp.]
MRTAPMRSVGRCLKMLGSLVLLWQVSLALGQGVPSIWYEDLATARRVAAETNRLLLLHFWAERCRPCRQMDAEVFSRPDVLSALATNYVAVKVNFDQATNLVRDLRVDLIPTDVILSPSGEVLQRFVGGASAERYIDRINQVAAAYRQRSMALAQSSTLPVSPPPNRDLRGPWTPTGQVPGPIGPSYQPPSFAANTNRSAAPFGVAPPMPDYQSGYAPQQAPMIPQGPSSYGQLAISPPVSSPSDNPIVPQGLSNNSPSWGYGANPAPAMGRQTDPLAAGTSPQVPHDFNQIPGQSPWSSPTPAANLGLASTPWKNPESSALGSPSASSSEISQPSPAAAVAAASPSRSSSKPKIEIPPGNPPLALDGYCPVSLTDKQRWVIGNPRWGARHEGRTYLFAGPEEQQKFLANPDRYAPVLSGLDVVQLVEASQMSDGCREFGAWFGGRVYLFSSEESYQKFSADPYRYINGLPQAVARLSQQSQGEASRARPQETRVEQNPSGQMPPQFSPAALGELPMRNPISTPERPADNIPISPPVGGLGSTNQATSTWTPPPTINIELPPSVQAVANGTNSPERPRWPVAQRPRW